MKQILTPKRAATAIGVSESSVKRWCDRGKIAFRRTAGGHRRIPIASIVEFLRSSELTVKQPELLGLPATLRQNGSPEPQGMDGAVDALVSGDIAGMEQIVFSLFLSGHRVASIADEVLIPSMQAVTMRMERGDIEVFQVRRAEEIVTRIMHELRGVLRAPGVGMPLAIGGTPEANPDALSTTIAETVLLENGWQAQSLGSRIPFPSLAAAAQDSKPTMFWLCLSAIVDEAKFLESYVQFCQVVPTETAIVVHSGSIHNELQRNMPRGSLCASFQQMEEFSRTMNAHQENSFPIPENEMES